MRELTRLSLRVLHDAVLTWTSVGDCRVNDVLIKVRYACCFNPSVVDKMPRESQFRKII